MTFCDQYILCMLLFILLLKCVSAIFVAQRCLGYFSVLPVAYSA